MSYRVFAPGKVVILGEYAVLDGAPAIVCAIDHGVSCAVELGGDELIIDTDKDPKFVRAALQQVDAAPGRYRFADSHRYEFDGKPGFGGSAAATVAAVTAGLHGRQRPLDRDAIFRTALAVHRRVQGGGSGIDIAASTYGGCLRFHHEQVSPLPPCNPVVIWSGQSASTGPRVKQYLQWDGRAEFVKQTERCISLFQTNPVKALEQGYKLLDGMAKQAGVAWKTPALATITQLATQCGGAAKPSGAGGGDCAVALFADDSDKKQFEADCASAAITIIEVNAHPGVCMTELVSR